MSKRVKRMMAEEIAGGLEGTDSCVVVSLGKIDVLSMTELRTALRQEQVSLRVFKNRVAKHALAGIGWDGVGEMFEGTSALAYGEGGALAASKLLAEWERKTPDGLSIRGGLLEGRVLGVEQVRKLATIPDRETLLSMLAAVVVAPIGQVASLVNEILAGVARAVGALAEQAEQEEGGE